MKKALAHRDDAKGVKNVAAQRTKSHMKKPKAAVRKSKSEEQPFLATIVQALMAKHHITTKEAFATRIGLTDVSVGRILSNEQQSMQPKNLVAMCLEFGLPVRPMLLWNARFMIPEGDSKAEQKKLRPLRDAVGEVPIIDPSRDIGEQLSLMASAPVLSEISIELDRWRAAHRQKRRVADLLRDYARVAYINSLPPVPELEHGAFLFLNRGVRMIGGGTKKTTKGLKPADVPPFGVIPDNAVVVIQPVEEEEIHNDDVVLVQFMVDRSNELEDEEPAGLYIYRRRIQDNYPWEEYHSLNRAYPMRFRTPGKFKQGRLQDERIIFGKALRIVHVPLIP